jgi:acid phosphatase type 7
MSTDQMDIHKIRRGRFAKQPGTLLKGVLVSAAVVVLLSSFSALAFAQHDPFIVHDTKPVIMHGPYLSSLSETGATIVWMTDTPCHAKVLFGAKGGALDREADNAEHGLLPVGTRHVVHLTGLEPGHEYAYKAVATRVVKMKAYWPEKGLAAESPERTFTTFDRAKSAIAFSAIADTHEDPARVKDLLEAIDWTGSDFVVHLGDAFHGLESEDQLFGRWLGPAERRRRAGSS